MTDTKSSGHTPLERGEVSAPEQFIFPVLTPPQLARIAAHGIRRPIRTGDILIEEGSPNVPIFVVTAGRIEVVRFTGTDEYIVAAHGPGQFTGEVNMVSGRRALFRVRVTDPGEVIEVDRTQIQTLLQTDSELSDILLRAFILRRVESKLSFGLGWFQSLHLH